MRAAILCLLVVSLSGVASAAIVEPSPPVTATGTASVATVAVNAPAGSTLVAMVAGGGPQGSSTQTSTMSGCVSWVPIKRANTRPGVADVWKSVTNVQLTSCPVTARLTAGSYFVRLVVAVMTGAGPVGTSASASSNKGPAQVSLTGLSTGSLVYGVGTDLSLAQTRTVLPGQRKLAESTSGTGTFWAQALISPTSTGSLLMGTSAPATKAWNFAAVEITMAAPVCSFTVSPTLINTAAVSGSSPVIVTATATSCGWFAVSGAGWLSVVPASGTGDGTVTVSYAANTGIGRSGTVTIGGQTVTVTQAPAPIATLLATCPPDQPAVSLNNQPVAVTYPVATTTGGVLPVSVVGSPPSGSLFPVGTSMVTQTATSADGQNDTCTLGVVVTYTPATTSLCDQSIQLTATMLHGTRTLLVCQPGPAPNGWKVSVLGTEWPWTPVITDVGSRAAAGPPSASGLTPYYLPLPLPTVGVFTVSSIAYNYNTTDGWAQVNSTNQLTVTVQ